MAEGEFSRRLSCPQQDVNRVSDEEIQRRLTELAACYGRDPRFAPEPENHEPLTLNMGRGSCSLHIPSAPGCPLSITQKEKYKFNDRNHRNNVCVTCVNDKKPWWNNCFAPNKQTHDRLMQYRVSYRSWAPEDLPEAIESGTLPISDNKGTPVVNEAFDDWNGAPRLTPYSTEAASPMSKATTVVEEIIQRSHAEEWTSPHFRDSLLSQPVSARKNGRLTTLGDYPYHPDWDVYWQKTPGNLQTHPTEQEYRYMTDHFKEDFREWGDQLRFWNIQYLDGEAGKTKFIDFYNEVLAKLLHNKYLGKQHEDYAEGILWYIIFGSEGKYQRAKNAVKNHPTVMDPNNSAKALPDNVENIDIQDEGYFLTFDLLTEAEQKPQIIAVFHRGVNLASEGIKKIANWTEENLKSGGDTLMYPKAICTARKDNLGKHFYGSRKLVHADQLPRPTVNDEGRVQDDLFDKAAQNFHNKKMKEYNDQNKDERLGASASATASASTGASASAPSTTTDPFPGVSSGEDFLRWIVESFTKADFNGHCIRAVGAYFPICQHNLEKRTESQVMDLRKKKKVTGPLAERSLHAWGVLLVFDQTTFILQETTAYVFQPDTPALFDYDGKNEVLREATLPRQIAETLSLLGIHKAVKVNGFQGDSRWYRSHQGMCMPLTLSWLGNVMMEKLFPTPNDIQLQFVHRNALTKSAKTCSPVWLARTSSSLVPDQRCITSVELTYPGKKSTAKRKPAATGSAATAAAGSSSAGASAFPRTGTAEVEGKLRVSATIGQRSIYFPGTPLGFLAPRGDTYKFVALRHRDAGEGKSKFEEDFLELDQRFLGNVQEVFKIDTNNPPHNGYWDIHAVERMYSPKLDSLPPQLAPFTLEVPKRQTFRIYPSSGKHKIEDGSKVGEVKFFPPGTKKVDPKDLQEFLRKESVLLTRKQIQTSKDIQDTSHSGYRGYGFQVPDNNYWWKQKITDEEPEPPPAKKTKTS